MNTKDPVIKLLEEILKKLVLIDRHITGSGHSPDQWIDGADVCRMFSISPRKLSYLRESGMIPWSRLGTKTLYRLGDLHRCLDDNRVHVNPGAAGTGGRDGQTKKQICR